MDEITKLGRYQIVKELGRGGMGIVFLARDPMIDREIALKIIKLGEEKDITQGNKELLERFFLEAKAAGRLTHPNIVTVYDVGEDDGKSYMALEFIEGRDLADVIRDEGPLPLERAARIAAQVADGLEFAHKKGIVHRDIKPGNILLSEGDQVKITDFGLARLQTSHHLTQTGHAVGSPSYMSPEQIQGDEVDGRSDIFSLGVMFYEMITGDRPFKADSISSLVFKIVGEEPPDPSQVVTSLPKPVDTVVKKMLMKNRGERFVSAAQVAQALRMVASGDTDTTKMSKHDWDVLSGSATVGFEPTALIAHDRKPVKKSFPAGLAAASLALLLMIGGGLYYFLSSGEPPSLDRPPDVVEPATPKEPAASPTAKEEPAVDTHRAPKKPETATAALALSGTPGATLYVDGVQKGTLPQTLKYPPGFYRIKVTKTGRKSYIEDVALAAGKTFEKIVTLEKLGTGSIRVAAMPWATVFINDENKGNTPLVVGKVYEGEVTVRLVHPDYRPFVKKVRVQRGKEAAIIHDFRGDKPASSIKKKKATLGSLHVTSRPEGEVYIGGVKKGKTPLTLNRLKPGVYKVVVKRPGMTDYKREIEIVPGIVTRLAIE